MNKEDLRNATKIDWFDPENPKDDYVVLMLLAAWGAYIEKDLLEEVYTEWKTHPQKWLRAI